MIISDSHKFVFHHVPKTGGSSITAALAPYCRNYEGVIPEETHGWQFEFHQPYYPISVCFGGIGQLPCILSIASV